MNISKIRKQIVELNIERSELIKCLLCPGEMIKGSLYQIARVCGNPNCKCARGEKHVSWYISNLVNGQTKLTYIGSSVPSRLEELSRRYQQRQKRLVRIRKIDKEISRLLSSLRNSNLISIKTFKSKTK